MRIISGNFKGKKINLPKDKNTRPLRDLVKESIFNLILHSKEINLTFDNSNILDLFSGSGSFGLECISRGSKDVVFCENYIKVINILERNIENIGCTKNTQVIIENTYDFLNRKHFDNLFDIIFLDPPFKETKIEELFTSIYEKKILNKDGIIILHRNKKSKDSIPSNCKILIKKNYGNSKVFFISF